MRHFVATGRGIRFAVLSVALGAVIPAAPAMAQSLPDALVTAYLNSPELAAARADVKVLSERAVQARAGGRVRVEGELSLAAVTQTNSAPDRISPTTRPASRSASSNPFIPAARSKMRPRRPRPGSWSRRRH